MTIDGGTNAITINSKVDGAQALTLDSSGAVALNGVIGSGTAPTSLTTNAGGSLALGANVTVAGNLDVNDPAATLTSGVTLTTTGSGTIDFAGTLDGAQDLTVASAGTTTFTGNVGASTALGDGTGAAVTINSTGLTTFNGTVGAASGMTGSGNVRFNENVTVAAGNTATTLNGSVTLDGLTFNSAGNTTLGDAGADLLTVSTAAVTVKTPGATLTIPSNVTINDGLTLTLGDGGATAISASGTIQGEAGGAVTSDLVVNTTGAASFTGAIGGGSQLRNLPVTQSGGTTFGAAVTSTGGTVLLTDTDGTKVIEFDGALTAPTLTTAGQDYALNLDGGSTITNAVTLSNTGAVRIGDGADTNTFTGGLVATAPASLSLAGTVAATNQAITLGDGDTALTLTADTDVSAGNGVITLGGALNGAYGLTLTTTGVANVDGVVGASAPITS